MSFKKANLFISLLLVVASCKTKFDDPKYTSGEADFSRYISVGGSFTAGFADNALYLEAQKNSFPALLANRFAIVGGGEFIQPLVNGGNGLGNKQLLKYGNTCGGLNGYYVTSLPNDATNLQWIGSTKSFNNLGVPGAKSNNLNDQYFGKSSGNAYYNRFASDTGSIAHGLVSSTILSDAGRVSDGTGTGPTFFSLWIGLNDFLNYALAGGESDYITSTDTFNSSIDTVLTALTSYSGQGIVANIPDVNSLPFFSAIPFNGLMLTQTEATTLNNSSNFTFTEGSNAFIVRSPLPDDTLRKMKAGEMVLFSAKDSIRCANWGTPQNPIPSKYILDATEVAKINNQIATYNSKLQSASSSRSLAFVDMNRFFHSLQSGIIFNGVTYNTNYLTGGAFSLDGIHPNSRGYALIANEFIRAINAKYKSSIPEVDANNYTGIRFP